MNILIIGGTRFIGPFVVKSLYEKGHEITLFHRGRNNMELPAGVKEILGDRKDLAGYKENFKNISPDVVLDMIALTEEDALGVMKTFRGIAGRIVTISSQDVYLAFGILNKFDECPVEKIPVTEESSLRRSICPYRGRIKGLENYDKIPVEKTVMSEPDLPGTILRLPMIYGPGDRQHRLYEFLKKMDDKHDHILLGKTRAEWHLSKGYAENMAYAVTLAVTDERAKGRFYNVGDEKTLSMIEWVKKIGEAAEWKGEVVIAQEEEIDDENNYEQDIIVDTERIRRELGYREIVSFEEGLRRTVAWEMANPPAV
jgi:nucleoside-diphosphate-sugar epimerase